MGYINFDYECVDILNYALLLYMVGYISQVLRTGVSLSQLVNHATFKRVIFEKVDDV